MRKASIAVLSAILVFGCKSMPSIIEATQGTVPLDSDKTLWSVSDVPQVGSVVRITFASNQKREVLRSSLYSNSLAAGYLPVFADIGDAETDIKSSKGIKIGLNFLMRGSDVNVNANSAAELKIKLSGIKVAQAESQMSFQEYLRSLDGAGRSSNPEAHRLMAQINSASRSQGRQEYWVVTKVFTANEAQISVERKSSISAGANCGSDEKPCIVPLVKIVPSYESNRDTQSLSRGANRPIFVKMMPIKVNSRGVIYLDEEIPGPAVIG